MRYTTEILNSQCNKLALCITTVAVCLEAFTSVAMIQAIVVVNIVTEVAIWQQKVGV